MKNELIKFLMENEPDIFPIVALWANGVVPLENVEKVCQTFNTSFDEVCLKANLNREDVISL